MNAVYGRRRFFDGLEASRDGFDQRNRSWDRVLPWWIILPQLTPVRFEVAKQLKKSVHSSDFIEGVRLYLDDLEHLIDLLRSRSLELELSDSEYSYENLDEVIASKGAKPRKLKCDFSRKDQNDWKHIQIWIHVDGSRMFVHCSGDESIPIGAEVKEFLRERIPWDFTALSPWLWACVFPAFLFLVPLSPLAIGAEAARRWLVPELLGLAGIVLMIATFAFNRWANFGLILRRRHEGGFVKRNGDKIVLLALGSLIGAAVTGAVQLFRR